MSISDHNFKIANQKQTLVLLHYFGGSAESWRWLIPLLEDDFDCVALNLPGFGGEPPLIDPSLAAMADFVRAKLEAMNLESYILIGHSMSGKIAVEMAANDPTFAIKQLILVAPSPPTTEQISDEQRQIMLKHPDIKQAESTLKNITIKPLTAEQQQLVIKNNLEADNKTWDWWVNTGTKHSLAEEAAQIFMPIYVLASVDDPAISFASVEKETIPHLTDAKLITTNSVGHLSPLEAPEWLADQIKKVLAKP